MLVINIEFKNEEAWEGSLNTLICIYKVRNHSEDFGRLDLIPSLDVQFALMWNTEGSGWMAHIFQEQGKDVKGLLGVGATFTLEKTLRKKINTGCKTISYTYITYVYIWYIYFLSEFTKKKVGRKYIFKELHLVISSLYLYISILEWVKGRNCLPEKCKILQLLLRWNFPGEADFAWHYSHCWKITVFSCP